MLQVKEGNTRMSKSPKLKIKNPFGAPNDDICELEQAERRFFSPPQDIVFLVESQVVVTYEELIKLARREDYRDKEFLQVEILPSLIAGG